MTSTPHSTLPTAIGLRQICPQPPTTSRRLSLPFLLHTTFLLLALFAATAHADGDWQSHCGLCHCTWNSGKKLADCKSHQFTAVPQHLTTELQVVDLSQNPIAELRAREFEDAQLSNMHKIYMRNCTMLQIHRDALVSLSVLIELDLSNNQLRDIRPGTFRDLTRVRNILLNNNYLERLDDLLFHDLRFLYKLEVRGNRLVHIGDRTFHKAVNLVTIELDHNRMQQLNSATFADMPQLRSLALLDNPWNCSCRLQEFQQFVMAHKLYTPPTACVQPPLLRGRLWSELSAEHFACRPRIVQPIGEQVAVEATGENVTLTCRINGSPQPTVEWVHNKRTIGYGDRKISIRHSKEVNRVESTDVYTSELTIVHVRSADRGEYVCSAANQGGKAEVTFRLTVAAQRGGGGFLGVGGSDADGGSDYDGADGVGQRAGANLLMIVGVAVIVLLAVLIVVVVMLCCYCRRIKKYTKSGSISESGLMGGGGGGGGGTMGGAAGSDKVDKAGSAMIVSGMGSGGGGGHGVQLQHGNGNGSSDSMLEGSVIMEMQKSLLTDVNPVVKPPRRVELDGAGSGDGGGVLDEAMELKKTLLEDTLYGNHNDDETHSVCLSDTTARSRTTYIDDGFGTNLPPDLLAFPTTTRFAVAQSPSLQSSVSQLPDHNSLYGHTKSPPSLHAGGTASPNSIYQQHPSAAHHLLQQQHQQHPHSIYSAPTSTPVTVGPSGYRTLQLPKQRGAGGLSLLAQHQQHQLQLLQQHQQAQQQPHHFSHYATGAQQQQQRSNSPASSSANAAATVLKQGYVTIPRKPRTPSWTPSLTSTMAADYPLLALQSPTPSQSVGSPLSPLASAADVAALIAAEPVYDNLGLRTTAGGNTMRRQKAAGHKADAAKETAATAAAVGFQSMSMKDRPLPATPRSVAGSTSSSAAAFEQPQSLPVAALSPLPQLYQSRQQQPDSLLMTASYSDSNYGGPSGSGIGVGAETESLYGSRSVKVPPRPPPKPKKKSPASATSVSEQEPQLGSTSHLFEDECEDGTEV